MTHVHELRIRVRYSETDQMGVVHHTAYLVWLEEGRTALMRDLGAPYDELERSGCAMGVRKLEVRYRAAARYGDEVLVRTSLGPVRGASVRFGYEVVRASDEELLLTGSVETVSLALPDFTPTGIPDFLKEALASAP